MKKLGLRGFKWFSCDDTARNGGVSIWKQVTCLQTLRLMHDITEPKSKVKENQLALSSLGWPTQTLLIM